LRTRLLLEDKFAKQEKFIYFLEPPLEMQWASYAHHKESQRTLVPQNITEKKRRVRLAPKSPCDF
jgi:hypothetical protein